jgi:hypothetical protein
MSVFSAVGYLVAVKGLMVPGNAARTAKNIAGHEDMFRFGILSLYLVASSMSSSHGRCTACSSP